MKFGVGTGEISGVGQPWNFSVGGIIVQCTKCLALDASHINLNKIIAKKLKRNFKDVHSKNV